MNSRPSTCITTTRCPRGGAISATPRPGVPGPRFSGRTIRGSRSIWRDQLALVPDMVAHGQDVGTGLEELVGNHGGQPVTAGGVLGVDDDRVERERRPQLRQFGQQHGAAGAPDHIADEQQPHALSPRAADGSPPR